MMKMNNLNSKYINNKVYELFTYISPKLPSSNMEIFRIPRTLTRNNMLTHSTQWRRLIIAICFYTKCSCTDHDHQTIINAFFGNHTGTENKANCWRKAKNRILRRNAFQFLGIKTHGRLRHRFLLFARWIYLFLSGFYILLDLSVLVTLDGCIKPAQHYGKTKID